MSSKNKGNIEDIKNEIKKELEKEGLDEAEVDVSIHEKDNIPRQIQIIRSDIQVMISSEDPFEDIDYLCKKAKYIITKCSRGYS